MPSQDIASAVEPSSADQVKPDGYDSPLSFDKILQAEDKALGDGSAQHTALCISGGGIRSATFSLGAIQGLADLGILEHFDYLSTVSGGGYIGSWLTAWKQRARGLANIVHKLESSAPPAPEGQLDPVQHLREYNNYLAPKLGFFSADTWTLAATVARNMFLNWLVFIPLLLFALMVPRIVLSLARLGETYNVWYPAWLANRFPDLEQALPALGGIFFAIGVFNVLRYLPGVGNQNHTQNQFLRYCFLPIFLAALALLTLDAWFTGADTKTPTTLTFWGLFEWIFLSGAAGYVAYTVFEFKRVRSKLRELAEKRSLRKWPRLKWISGLVIAAILTNFSTAGGAWLLASHYFGDLSWPVYVTLAMPLLLLSFALAIAIFVGFTSLVFEDEDREWLARAGAWGLLCTLSWAGFAALALLAPKWLFHLHSWADSTFAATGGFAGVLAALAGLSNKTKAQPNESGTPEAKRGKWLQLAGKLAAPVFIAVFLTLLAILTNWILWKTVRVGNWKDHWSLLENTRTEHAFVLALIFLLFSVFLARYININKFSLQAMYRSRLIRAYPGASNATPETNDFTGFAGNDNFLMADLDPQLKPFHVINMTLNLVAGNRLAWQQRKAESFTVSALHSGYGDFYRPSRSYGGEGGISLGTAVAISGAAASPNMGYNSSPALTFIMTLFNARLGSWLGNPKQKKWGAEGPRSAFGSIVREAFGLTNDTSPYVYLSDGGHFENLALYEMVRRRCRYIVVLDGGADPKYTYEDLGNALRKIRIDHRISIEFKPPFKEQLDKPNASHSAKQPTNRCAIGEIRYQDLDPTLENGVLIYIKPVVLGNEAPDVISYKTANDDFPNQTTADQFFDESQTESYRMLGLWSVTDVFQPWGNEEFAALRSDAARYLELDQAARAKAATERRRNLAQAAAERRRNEEAKLRAAAASATTSK